MISGSATKESAKGDVRLTFMSASSLQVLSSTLFLPLTLPFTSPYSPTPYFSLSLAGFQVMAAYRSLSSTNKQFPGPEQHPVFVNTSSSSSSSSNRRYNMALKEDRTRVENTTLKNKSQSPWRILNFNGVGVFGYKLPDPSKSSHYLSSGVHCRRVSWLSCHAGNKE